MERGTTADAPYADVLQKVAAQKDKNTAQVAFPSDVKDPANPEAFIAYLKENAAGALLEGEYIEARRYAAKLWLENPKSEDATTSQLSAADLSEDEMRKQALHAIDAGYYAYARRILTEYLTKAPPAPDDFAPITPGK